MDLLENMLFPLRTVNFSFKLMVESESGKRGEVVNIRNKKDQTPDTVASSDLVGSR